MMDAFIENDKFSIKNDDAKFVFNMMNSALKMTNSALKMTNSALEMTNSALKTSEFCIKRCANEPSLVMSSFK